MSIDPKGCFPIYLLVFPLAVARCHISGRPLHTLGACRLFRAGFEYRPISRHVAMSLARHCRYVLFPSSGWPIFIFRRMGWPMFRRPTQGAAATITSHEVKTRSFSAHSVDRIVTEPKWRRRGGFPSGGQQAGDGIVGGGGCAFSYSLASLWQSGRPAVLQMARVPYLLAGLFLGVGACVYL